MLPSMSTFSMSNTDLHNHGISVSSSPPNTVATPSEPSNPEYALTIGGSSRASPRTRASKVTALDPITKGSLTLPQRADNAAIHELEGQSRHEVDDSRPPSTRTCQEPPYTSSTSAPPCGGHGPHYWHLLASSLLLNNCLKTGTPGYLRPTV